MLRMFVLSVVVANVVADGIPAGVAHRALALPAAQLCVAATSPTS